MIENPSGYRPCQFIKIAHVTGNIPYGLTLMIGIEAIPEMSVIDYKLTWLIAQENFTNFRSRIILKSFKPSLSTVIKCIPTDLEQLAEYAQNVSAEIAEQFF